MLDEGESFEAEDIPLPAAPGKGQKSLLAFFGSASKKIPAYKSSKCVNMAPTVALQHYPSLQLERDDSDSLMHSKLEASSKGASSPVPSKSKTNNACATDRVLSDSDDDLVEPCIKRNRRKRVMSSDSDSDEANTAVKSDAGCQIRKSVPLRRHDVSARACNVIERPDTNMQHQRGCKDLIDGFEMTRTDASFGAHEHVTDTAKFKHDSMPESKCSTYTDVVDNAVIRTSLIPFPVCNHVQQLQDAYGPHTECNLRLRHPSLTESQIQMSDVGQYKQLLNLVGKINCANDHIHTPKTKTVEDWLSVIATDFPEVAVKKMFRQYLECQKSVVLSSLKKIEKCRLAVRTLWCHDDETKSLEAVVSLDDVDEKPVMIRSAKRDSKDIRSMFSLGPNKQNVKKRSQYTEPVVVIEVEGSPVKTKVVNNFRKTFPMEGDKLGKVCCLSLPECESQTDERNNAKDKRDCMPMKLSSLPSAGAVVSSKGKENDIASTTAAGNQKIKTTNTILGSKGNSKLHSAYHKNNDTALMVEDDHAHINQRKQNALRGKRKQGSDSDDFEPASVLSLRKKSKCSTAYELQRGEGVITQESGRRRSLRQLNKGTAYIDPSNCPASPNADLPTVSLCDMALLEQPDAYMQDDLPQAMLLGDSACTLKPILKADCSGIRGLLSRKNASTKDPAESQTFGLLDRSVFHGRPSPSLYRGAQSSKDTRVYQPQVEDSRSGGNRKSDIRVLLNSSVKAASIDAALKDHPSSAEPCKSKGCAIPAENRSLMDSKRNVATVRFDQTLVNGMAETSEEMKNISSNAMVPELLEVETVSRINAIGHYGIKPSSKSKQSLTRRASNTLLRYFKDDGKCIQEPLYKPSFSWSNGLGETLMNVGDNPKPMDSDIPLTDEAVPSPRLITPTYTMCLHVSDHSHEEPQVVSSPLAGQEEYKPVREVKCDARNAKEAGFSKSNVEEVSLKIEDFTQATDCLGSGLPSMNPGPVESEVVELKCAISESHALDVALIADTKPGINEDLASSGKPSLRRILKSNEDSRVDATKGVRTLKKSSYRRARNGEVYESLASVDMEPSKDPACCTIVPNTIVIEQLEFVCSENPTDGKSCEVSCRQKLSHPAEQAAEECEPRREVKSDGALIHTAQQLGMQQLTATICDELNSRRKSLRLRKPVHRFDQQAPGTSVVSEILQTDSLSVPGKATKARKKLTAHADPPADAQLTSCGSVKNNMDDASVEEARGLELRGVADAFQVLFKSPKKKRPVVEVILDENVVNSHLSWTEKYQPRKARYVLGERARLKKIFTWLKEWKEKHDSIMKRMTAKATSKGSKKDNSDDSDLDSDEENSLCNTLLLSGPIGCGTTSAVYACAKQMEFKVIELNPSTVRTGKQILDSVSEAVVSHQVKSQMRACPRRLLGDGEAVSGNRTLSTFVAKAGTGEERLPKVIAAPQHSLLRQNGSCENRNSLVDAMSLVLFEQVDVVYEELDKGFWQGITELQRLSKRPIILTSNTPNITSNLDRESDSWFEHVHLSRPSLVQILPMVQLMCLAERVYVPTNVLRKVINQCKCDMRKIMLLLQFWFDQGKEPLFHVWKPVVKEPRMGKEDRVLGDTGHSDLSHHLSDPCQTAADAEISGASDAVKECVLKLDRSGYGASAATTPPCSSFPANREPLSESAVSEQIPPAEIHVALAGLATSDAQTPLCANDGREASVKPLVTSRKEILVSEASINVLSIAPEESFSLNGLHRNEISVDHLIREPVSPNSRCFTFQRKPNRSTSTTGSFEVLSDNLSWFDSHLSRVCEDDQRDKYWWCATVSQSLLDRHPVVSLECDTFPARESYSSCNGLMEKLYERECTNYLPIESGSDGGGREMLKSIVSADDASCSLKWRTYQSVEKHTPLLSASQRRSFATDYLPYLREICSSEQVKREAQPRRKSRRYLHYLDNIGMCLEEDIVQALSQNSFPT